MDVKYGWKLMIMTTMVMMMMMHVMIAVAVAPGQTGSGQAGSGQAQLVLGCIFKKNSYVTSILVLKGLLTLSI